MLLRLLPLVASARAAAAAARRLFFFRRLAVGRRVLVARYYNYTYAAAGRAAVRVVKYASAAPPAISFPSASRAGGSSALRGTGPRSCASAAAAARVSVTHVQEECSALTLTLERVHHTVLCNAAQRHAAGCRSATLLLSTGRRRCCAHEFDNSRHSASTEAIAQRRCVQ